MTLAGVEVARTGAVDPRALTDFVIQLRPLSACFLSCNSVEYNRH